MPEKNVTLVRDETLAQEIVDAIWSMWKAKTVMEYGDHPTSDQMLSVAKFTAHTFSAFMDRKPLANTLYQLLEQRIAEAVVLVVREQKAAGDQNRPIVQ